MPKAILYLEDDTSFMGESLLVSAETAGEVVFNTAMTGYQEILTDPSYAGQIVVMTYPLIGNYGVNEEDVESKGVHLKGFVAKEFCRRHSNFRATQSLTDYLKQNNILAIEGIDTRALTRHLRLFGAMKGMISTENFDKKVLKAKLAAVPGMEGCDWVKTVTSKEKYIWPAQNHSQGSDSGLALNPSAASGSGSPEGRPRFKVAAIDCGIKFNILRILNRLGCEVHVFPANTNFSDIMAVNPDGLFLSNGPGDPAAVTYVIRLVQESLGKLPIFGICLGNQIIGLALGGKTYKMKFGHHGANHPVKDAPGNRIGITSQNHGFCVDPKTLDPTEVDVIHTNLNDHTVEGLRHKRYPLFSIQYHPEAAPGPTDAQYLFGEFIGMMESHKRGMKDEGRGT